MKTKTQPIHTNSGNYMEQSVMNGLSKAGQQYAKDQIKEFESASLPVPYGFIRKMALLK